MRLLLAGLLAVFLAVAQPEQAPKNARLEGRVVSAAGEPVPKVFMWLNGSIDIPRVYTDTDGTFVFENVPPGQYTLSAQKAGFVTQRYGTRSSAIFELSPGMELKDLTIKMPLEGVISGKVTDSDGDPVQGAYAELLRYGYVQGGRKFERVLEDRTNDRGQYRFSNLPAGRYYLGVGGLQDRVLAGQSPEGNVPTFYPSALDARSAAAVDVVAGAEIQGIDVRLRREKIFSIHGTALGIGAAVGGAPSVHIVRTDAREIDVLPHTVGMDVRPDGSFEFDNLIAGTYVVEGIGVLIGRREVVLGSASVENVVLSLRPTPEIAGRVSLEDGDLRTLIKPASTPVREGLSRADPGWPAIRLVTPDDPNGRFGGSFSDDGTFHFFGVGPHKYGLNVTGFPDGIYVKSVRFGERDVTHASIDNTEGMGGNLQIVLSARGATVAGLVHNEKGALQAGAAVTLWPKLPDLGSGTGGLKQGRTNKNGTFRFVSLPPGEYFVAAWEDLDPELAQNAEFLTLFNGGASKVTLSENGHGSVDVKIIPGDRIAAEIAKLP